MPPNYSKRQDIERKCLEIKKQCDNIGSSLDEGKLISAYKCVDKISKLTESVMLRNREQ
jgi:hypothetical protein